MQGRTTRALGVMAVLCLVMGAMGKWREQVVVEKEDGEIEFVKSYAYTDKSTGRSFVTWIKPADHSLYLRIVEPDGKLTEVVKISTDQRVLYEMKAKVTGYNDGKRVHVTFLGTRSREEGACDAKDQRGCDDVYFVETEDGGNSWSKPIAVPRLDMHDVFHRDDIESIASWENGRIWIAYAKISVSDPSDSVIHMVTRPPMSKIFSNEFSLKIKPGFFRFFLNYYKDTPVLSVFWKFEDAGKGYVMESRDSGIHWEKPKEVEACEEGDGLETLHVGGANLPEYTFAVCKSATTGLYMKHSADIGKTWAGKLAIPGVLMYDEGCVAGDSYKPESTYVMYLLQTKEGEKAVGYATITSESITLSKPKQFASLMQYHTCRFHTGPQYFLWTLTQEQDSLFIKLDQNDNLLDTVIQ